MNRQILPLFLFLLAVAAFIPCSASGEIKCTHGVPITEPPFGVTAEVGVPVTFSDIGCAVVWRSLQCAMDQAEFDKSSMVQDYKTGEAVAMQKASFAFSCGLSTPMGYDIAAFKSREEAEVFTAGKTGCRVLTYGGLLDAGLK